MIKPITAGVILTRKCNLRCSYCAIPSRQEEDLSVEDWREIIDIIANIGIRRINFIGGEPLLYKGVTEVVSHALNSRIEYCSLITNGVKAYRKLRELLDVGLRNVSFSIDTLNTGNSLSPLKAESALSLLKKLEEDGFISNLNLTAYCVVNQSNLSTIPSLVEFLSSKGVGIYFLPYHWSKDKKFEHRRTDEVGIALNSSQAFLGLIEQLIEMHGQGYKINNSVEFLRDIPRYIENLDWKCSFLSELRVDSNGKMMCCCDKRGSVNDRFKIFDLKESKGLDHFLEARDLDSQSCSGCLWPSSYEAERLNSASLNE